jgi:hypothetical protein
MFLFQPLILLGAKEVTFSAAIAACGRSTRWHIALGPHLHLMRQMTPVASVGDMANSSNHLKPLIHVIINDIQ